MASAVAPATPAADGLYHYVCRSCERSFSTVVPFVPEENDADSD